MTTTPPDARNALAEIVAVATVEDHNAAFDPANDVLGGAFKDGFREGWLFAQDPGFDNREDLESDYGRTVDIAPSECWDAYRSHYFAMLPLAAIPEVGAPSPASTDKSRIAALEAQVEGMRVALEPFAKVEPMDVYESEDEDARGVYVLTQGDFRRARAALQSSETTGEK